MCVHKKMDNDVIIAGVIIAGVIWKDSRCGGGALPVKNRFVHFQTTLFGIHFSLDKIGQLQHITYLDVSAHPGLSDSVVVF